jgi:hypothetical protein
MFENEMLEVVEPLESWLLTVNVIVDAAGVALVELSANGDPLPPVNVTVAVTVELVSKVKPAGAVRTMVPGVIALPEVSAITGPLSVVHPPPIVSAEMELPPVAPVTVTLTAARTAVAESDRVVKKMRSLAARSLVIIRWESVKVG